MTGININSIINLSTAETKAPNPEDIIPTNNTITRYIYIKNIDDPVKIFRETAV